MNILRAKRAITGLALAAIVAAPFAVPAQPALAWDQHQYIPCKSDPHIPYDPSKGQSVKWRYDRADKSAATLIVFLDKLKLEEHGHAERYHFTTSGKGCKLFKTIKKDYVSVVAKGPGGA